MAALGIFLLVVGACDLLRAVRDVTSVRRRLTLTSLGVTLLVVAALASGLEGTEWLGLGSAWVVGFALWTLGSAAALTGGAAAGAARAVGFAGLAVGVGGSVLGGGVIAVSGAYEPLGGSLLAGYDRGLLILVAGVVLLQLSTANIAVRMLLDAVGVPASDGEKQLKGGRLLGPMERLTILLLGIAGSLTAASLVVAAKGLLRFPELQRDARTGGASDVTEYFLIGSFASWLLALGGALVVRLALAPAGMALGVPWIG